MNTCYYYQSFVGLDKILTHPKDLDILIISSIHFGKTKENKNYIHLNDNDPNNLMSIRITEFKLYFESRS